MVGAGASKREPIVTGCDRPKAPVPIHEQDKTGARRDRRAVQCLVPNTRSMCSWTHSDRNGVHHEGITEARPTPRASGVHRQGRRPLRSAHQGPGQRRPPHGGHCPQQGGPPRWSPPQLGHHHGRTVLTSNLHPPIIRECKETGKQYEADTHEAMLLGGEIVWWKHTHTDGSVCECHSK